MQRKSLTLLTFAFSLLTLFLLQMSATQAAVQQQNATPTPTVEPAPLEQPLRIKIRQSIPLTISLLAVSEMTATEALTETIAETELLTPTATGLEATAPLTESIPAATTELGAAPALTPTAELASDLLGAAEVTATEELTPPLIVSSVAVTLEIDLDFVVTQTLTTTVPASVALQLSDLLTQTVPISVIVAPFEAGSAQIELVLPEELLATPTLTPTEALTATEAVTPTVATTPTVEAAPAPAVSGVPLITTSVIENANLRAGPGTNFAIVGQATAGQEVQVAAVSEDGGWYLLGNGAWIANFLVAAPEAAVPVVNDEILRAVTGQAAPTGVVTPTVTVDANLRAGPGTEFDVIGGTVTGQTINIVGRNADGTWFRLDNGGWVFAALVANPPPLESVPVVNADGTPVEAAPAAAPQPEQASGLGGLLPTPTPTPTPQPQPRNEELDAYLTAALELIRQFDLVQTSLDGLLREVNANNALLEDANWTTRMNAALTLLRRTSASVGELTVPADAQAIHSQLEAAALSYAQAASALATAVQNRSIAQLQEADALISAAVSGLTAAETAILQARGQ